MRNFTSIVIDGNLTADPELRTTATGKKVANFSIAVNHLSQKEEDGSKSVSYFDVEVWERRAENCAEYLSKGSKVTVIGKLRQDRWQSPEGSNRQKVKIVADEVRFDTFSSPDRMEEAA